MQDKSDKDGSNKGDTIAITIRFPKSLYKKIKALSKNERRSYNSQVVRILEKYLDG